ncbi:Glucokinase [Sulfitobacter noctilucae]|uniref:glucokinase n=1 Tax=Sulfitobacter noctilucae TaxID=1342302 RepID=UPI00046945A1|nr:glucokinase [Sulfitobacter noctilucae]KIN65555.1 Glucokinase [Sulfitobacter noctilucae]
MNATTGTTILADVGGTNTRVATAGISGPENIRHFANDEFTSVYGVLDRYKAQAQIGTVTACSIAMAGPVRGNQGRLTNRAWDISVAGIRAHLGCDVAVLLNDLTALGFALGSLPADRVAYISAVPDTPSNGQALVVGIGTGFNLCPVRRSADGTVHCFEVEMGHAALPAPLRDALEQDLGQHAKAFPTLEHLFSGNGLAQFHAFDTGTERTARAVVEASESGDPAAMQTLMKYTGLLGQLCSELAFQYMPLEGLYFAGSVARGILQPAFLDRLQAAPAAGKIGDMLTTIPKAVILDDAAALRGCLAALDASR